MYHFQKDECDKNDCGHNLVSDNSPSQTITFIKKLQWLNSHYHPLITSDPNSELQKTIEIVERGLRRVQSTTHPSTPVMRTPSHNGMYPFDRIRKAIALPITCWTSAPIIATSVMIQRNIRAHTGYSSRQSSAR